MASTPLAVIGGLGTTELIIILVIVVIFFGVGKLPQVGKQLGQGIRNFKSELKDEGADADDGTRAQLEDQSVAPDLAPRDVTEEHTQTRA